MPHLQVGGLTRNRWFLRRQPSPRWRGELAWALFTRPIGDVNVPNRECALAGSVARVRSLPVSTLDLVILSD